MMALSRESIKRPLVLLVVALLVFGGWTVLNRASSQTATLYFASTKGLYVGDDVTVLGVPVGKVTAVEPGHENVRVEIEYDATVPADVKAVITSPSLVPVRNVALTPVYAGGPKLSDDATIPESRTAVPVEWDDIKSQVDELARLLGPEGVNKDGSLSRAVDVAAKNVDGQGHNLNATVTAMAEAMSTLADNRGDLFATVRNLSVFTKALADSDAQVVEFNGRLASVSQILGENSESIGTAIDGLNRAMDDVTAFLKANGESLSQTVKDVRPLTKVLAEKRQYLADILHIAPTGMSNLYSIYDPIDGSLTASLAASNLQAPAVMICTALLNLGGTFDQCRTTLGPLADALAQGPPGVGISATQRNGRSNQVYARPGPEPEPGSPNARPDLASTMMGSGQ